MSEAQKIEPPMPTLYSDTHAPDVISEELAPVIAKLGLTENCRQLAMEGWTVVRDAATPEFNARLRDTILKLGGGNMLLAKDPVFAEAILNPKLLAMAEFSVGRGFLISQVAASVRAKDSPPLGLHADQNWIPAPFPVHNMLLTACWACDEYTKAGGSTMVIPGSGVLRRHPNPAEVAAKSGAIAIECPAGSIAMWDGSIWHGNWPRTIEGQRVVSHITYSRLMMRQIENYSAQEDALIAKHGGRMAQLLGREDSLFKPTGFDYKHIASTFNNSKR